MLRLLVDEFNCNHQADVSAEHASSQMTIYNRNDEEKQIREFLTGNME